MVRKGTRISFFFAAILFLQTPLAAMNLGLTPSHVFGLWENINDALPSLSGAVIKDDAFPSRIAALAPRKFANKKPADVLREVAVFRSKLDHFKIFRIRLNTAVFKPSDPERHKKDEVTPREVFMNSGYILDSITSHIIALTSPDVLISPFYRHRNYKGKMPNDVFALVDLANRRIDLMIKMIHPNRTRS
jgi:hypothetical protein